jgi:hypothetical protein
MCLGIYVLLASIYPIDDIFLLVIVLSVIHLRKSACSAERNYYLVASFFRMRLSDSGVIPK